MTLPIITADERLKETRGIKGVIFGKYGIGKTSLLWTLPSETTLFIDLEAGDLAVEGWQGDTITPRTWQECRDIAAFIGGLNPALNSDQPYSRAHYGAVCEKYGDPGKLNKYETIFIDSITVAGRLCLQWCKNNPQCSSNKTGREDLRSVYGLHGQEMISWLTHLQHTRGKNIWFVGILDEKLDEFNRKIYSPQIDGNKAINELPAIVDQVITMAEIKGDRNTISNLTSCRAFINHTINPYFYPAKDRSGRLDMLEEAHLGKLMQKIKEPMENRNRNLTYQIMAAQDTATTTTTNQTTINKTTEELSL